MKDILSDLTLPVKVRLIYGKPPVVPCIFTGMLVIKESKTEEVIPKTSSDLTLKTLQLLETGSSNNACLLKVIVLQSITSSVLDSFITSMPVKIHGTTGGLP
jgi:hypothetical protein